MKFCGSYILIIILLTLFSPVDAHVPLLVADNENIEYAALIEDPIKSWAIYDELRDGGGIHYYRFSMEKGQILSLTLFVPENDGFIPSLIIMGPGIKDNGTYPSNLEIPRGAGVLILEGELPDKAIYEPFTPSSHYMLAEIALHVEEEGTYYLAVYDPEMGGRYGLAIGSREEFTFIEWITVPLNVIRIHEWEGQSLSFILLPMITIVTIGFLFIFRTYGSKGYFNMIGWLAGLFYLGSGTGVLIQMFIALSRASFTLSVLITLMIVLFSILAGIAILHTSFQDTITVKSRVKMIILGIIGLFSWAGIVIGPFLAIIAGFLPSEEKGK